MAQVLPDKPRDTLTSKLKVLRYSLNKGRRRFIALQAQLALLGFLLVR
jgi:hypothetical protein